MSDDLNFIVDENEPLTLELPGDNELIASEIRDIIVNAVSPRVEVIDIVGGHRIIVTDIDGEHVFDVMNGANGKDGEDGKDGKDGKDGEDGEPGIGIPTGGTNGELLVKDGANDYVAKWDSLLSILTNGTGTSEFFQLVAGLYNQLDDEGKYALIIGNGSSDANRSNAFELDRDGFTYYQNAADSDKPTRADAAPVSNTALNELVNYDKDGVNIGFQQIVKNTSNAMYRSFAVQNETDDGTPITTGLYLWANRDGTRRATLTSGCTWPVANGGTGIADFLTVGSIMGTMTAVTTTLWTTLLTARIPAGKWLVLVSCYCTTATGGTRQFFFTDDVNGNVMVFGQGVTIAPGMPGYQVFPVFVSNTEEKPYYIRCYQGSGSDVNMRGAMQWIKLG